MLLMENSFEADKQEICMRRVEIPSARLRKFLQNPHVNLHIHLLQVVFCAPAPYVDSMDNSINGHPISICGRNPATDVICPVSLSPS